MSRTWIEPPSTRTVFTSVSGVTACRRGPMPVFQLTRGAGLIAAASTSIVAAMSVMVGCCYCGAMASRAAARVVATVASARTTGAATATNCCSGVSAVAVAPPTGRGQRHGRRPSGPRYPPTSTRGKRQPGRRQPGPQPRQRWQRRRFSNAWSSRLVYFDAEYGRLLHYNAEADGREGGGSAAVDDTTTEARKRGASGDVAADPRGAEQV